MRLDVDIQPYANKGVLCRAWFPDHAEMFEIVNKE